MSRKRASPASQPLPEPLNARELEVLSLVASGLSNREIAGKLFVTVNTVKWYLKGIFGKLHVANRAQAVARAQALGLLVSTIIPCGFRVRLSISLELCGIAETTPLAGRAAWSVGLLSIARDPTSGLAEVDGQRDSRCVCGA